MRVKVDGRAGAFVGNCVSSPSMPIDPKQLAALRTLISKDDATSVRQGIELLRTLDDRDLWSLMVDGVQVDSTGSITIGKDSEIARRARPTRRGELALWALRGAGRLADVERLDLRELGELHDLDAVAGLTCLRELRHWQTTPLANIDGLAGLTRLEVLHMGRLARGTTLDALAALVNLREVVLAGVEGVTTLDPLAACVHLRSLDVRWGDSLRDLGALTACTALRSLTLGDVPDLATLAGHTGLGSLTLSPAPTNMRGIATLTGVRTLRLTGVVSPKNLGEIAKMPALETLKLEDAGPTHLAKLAGAPTLTTLEVAGATFKALTLSGSATLQSLSFERCDAIEKVGNLSGLPALRSLTFKSCKALADLGGLSTAPRLEALDLSGCTAVRDVDVLSALEALTRLDLRGCTGLHWSIEQRLYAGARAGTLPARLRTRAPTVATIGKNPARKSSETKLIHRLLCSTERDEFEEGLALAVALGDSAIWLPYRAGGIWQWDVHYAFRHRIIEATLPEDPTSLRFDVAPASEHLNMDLPTVENIEALRVCTELRSLTLRCSARDITPLAALARLETLTLRCAAEDLTPLAACASLRELTLSCRSRNLDGLAGCTGLRKLTLLGWSDLEQVNALAQLPNLEDLSYEHCACIENGAKGRMQGEELAAAMQWLRDSQAK